MSNAISVGDSDVAGVWTKYIIRQLVPGLKAELVISNYTEPARIPMGVGGYIGRWLVPTMNKGTTSALVAGTINTKSDLVTITSVEATIADYGDHFEIDDLAKETQIREALDAYKDMMQYEGATCIDALSLAAGLEGTNFLHAGDSAVAGVTLAAGDQLKAKDLPVIAGFFHGTNAKGWDGLSRDYMLAIHPVVETTMVTDVTTTAISWTDVNKNVPVGFDQLLNNHRYVGRYGGVTVLRTTMIGTVTEDVAAYANLALARYGVGSLGLSTKGFKAPKIMFKSPGPQSTNDPLDQTHTLGWKVRGVARILDSNRALTVYSAVDAS